MKIVIYDEAKNVLGVIDNVDSPIAQGNDVQWVGGSAKGIGSPFAIFDDAEVIGERLTDNQLARDQREAHAGIDLAQENADLKVRLTAAEDAVLAIMMS